MSLSSEVNDLATRVGQEVKAVRLEIGAKANASHTHTAANISDSTATGRSVLTATDAAAARTAIGALQSDPNSLTIDATNDRVGLAGNTAPAVPVDIGMGDSQHFYTPIDPQVMRLRHGTAAAPVNIPGPTLKVSRVETLTRAQIEAVGGVGTDGGEQLAAIVGVNSGTVSTEVQPVGVYGAAKTASTLNIVANDAAGGYFVGRALEGSTGTGIGAFIAGRRETTGRANALEVHVRNGGAAVAYTPSAFPAAQAIWINAGGAADSASAININNAFGRQFDVGIGFGNMVNNSLTGGVKTASIYDASSSARSLHIAGTHSTAAITVADNAGVVQIGHDTATPGALLDIRNTTTGRNIIYARRANGQTSDVIRFANHDDTTTLFSVGSSGHIRPGAGTVSFPSFAHHGDSDTGLNLNGSNSNKLSLVAGGTAMQHVTPSGVQFFNGETANFGGGVGVVGLTNATTAPTTNPTGGIVLYSDTGTLKYRDPSGNVRVLDGSGATPPAASETVSGIVELATAEETTTGTSTTLAVHPAGLKVELDKKAPTSHTHTASQISDSTATGRSVLTATDAAAARTAIGAGTSNLVIGTTASTAKAGDYQPTAANISDSTATGRSVITATDAAAARTAIGAGTSNLVIGTTSNTAKAGDYQPTAANISDSTATGRSLITATDAAAARTAIGAGTSNLAIGTTGTTAAAGNDARLSDARTPTAHSHPASDLTATGTRDATTFLRGDNTWSTVTAAAPANMMTTDTAQTITAGVKTFRPNQLLMSNADGTLTAEPYSDVNPPLTLNLSENGATAIPTPVSGQATVFTRDGTGLRMKNDAGVEGIIGAIGSDALVDGATIATNANTGNLFRVTVAGDRTFSAPTNPVDGQRIMYEITASGANRTVTFATGSAGAFAYGTDFTSIPVITNGTTTFVGAMYSSRSQRWHILAVGSGHL